MKKILVLVAAVLLSACSKPDMGKRMLGVLEDIAAIVEANQNDCSKMNDELKNYMEKKGKAEKAAIEEWEKHATEEDRNAALEKYATELGVTVKRMLPVTMKCASDKSFQEIIKAL